MGRPVGEVRLALQVAAAEKPGHLRDLARRAGVGLQIASRTVQDMRRAGELSPCGKQYVAWRRGPVQVWGPPDTDVPGPEPRAGTDLQAHLLRSWR